MESHRVVETDEVLDIYRTGQRSGFIAGVIFCVGTKFIWDRRKKYRIERIDRPR